jgi:transcriptional regulator with XRE-family HTH domain
VTTLDWRRLADEVKAELGRRRRAEDGRRWTQADLASAAGVTTRTVERLLSGRSKQLPDSMPAIESALDWPAGTGWRLVMGEDPFGRPGEKPAPRPLDYLRERVLTEVASHREQLRLLGLIDAREREHQSELGALGDEISRAQSA